VAIRLRAMCRWGQLPVGATTKTFFQGGLEVLVAVAAGGELPLLCKRLHPLHPISCIQARAAGADAAL